MARTRIAISGASRGIGEALARGYAGPDVSLLLIGRDVERLEGVASACREAGAEVKTLALDIRDRGAAAEALGRADEAQPIDLLVANAGVHLSTQGEPGDIAAAHEEIETNLLGALNTVEPIAARMARRGRGQIALMSSLAAYTPMPDSPGYSASKAGLLVYGLALRARLRTSGVKVNVVCPGYVDAGMGLRNKGWKPMLISAERSVAKIRRGLERDRAVIAFPAPLAWVARWVQFLPEWLGRLLLGSSRFKVGEPSRARDGGGSHG